MELSNRTIVITGASKGLGAALSFRLCVRGVNLVLIARDEDLLIVIKNRITALSGRSPLIIACDVSDNHAVRRAAEVIGAAYPQVDVLVNNAGIGIHKKFEEMSWDEMRRQHEVNCFGPYYFTNALLPALRKSDSAYILNVGSLASLVPFGDNYLYAGTKNWLARFSEGLRRELRIYDIRVGLILPGLMRTSFISDFTVSGSGRSVPPFMILDPDKVATVMVRMILGRTRVKAVYGWMLLPMKLRQTFDNSL